MSTILYGAYGPDYHELEGWSLKSMGRGLKKIGKAATMPIRVTRRALGPVTRPVGRFASRMGAPVDRMLKRTPVVRSLYRAQIGTGYMLTGRFSKGVKAYKRTGTALLKDVSFVKRRGMTVTKKVARPLVKKAIASGKSKTQTKIMLTPTITAGVTALYPPAAPFTAFMVPLAIDQVWKQLKKQTRAVLPTTKPYTALKMDSIPEVGPQPPDPFAGPRVNPWFKYGRPVVRHGSNTSPIW